MKRRTSLGWTTNDGEPLFKMAVAFWGLAADTASESPKAKKRTNRDIYRLHMLEESPLERPPCSADETSSRAVNQSFYTVQSRGKAPLLTQAEADHRHGKYHLDE
jgi:hypothetical protein